MKKNIFMTIAFVAACTTTSQLFAQEIAKAEQKTRTKSNNTNERVSTVKISGTESSCDIVFNHEIKSPRDAASGQATGKRVHKPFHFSISSTDQSITEITSPRDVATGQSSGKRTAGTPIGGIIVKGGKNPGGTQFNKIVVEGDEFTLPADCPDGEYNMKISWSWGASNPGSSKRCEVYFVFTIEEGVCMAINEKGLSGSKK